MLKFDYKESEIYKGFYTTIDSEILASKEGDLIWSVSGEKVEQTVSTHWSYLVVVRKGRPELLVHRFLALTFLEVPDNYEELVVDHLDGNKLNNRIDNLEWVTRSENAIRAYKNGLRTDNRLVFCKDLRTGEERCFYSLNECARFLLVNGGAITEYLNKKQYAPFKYYFVLRFSDGEYPNIGIESIGLARNGDYKEVAVEYVNENVFVLFRSHAEASAYTGVNRIVIGKYLNQTPRKIRDNMRFWSKQELVEGTPIKDMRGERAKPVQTPRRMPVPIKVTNVKTKEVTYYDSTETFAKKHNQKKNTVQKKMYLQNGMWRHYLIEYQRNKDKNETKSDLSETVG